MAKKLITSYTALAVTMWLVHAPFPTYNTNTVMAAEELKAPNYKNRAEIPAQYKWQLDHIYKDKAAWEKDLRKVEELANAFVTHQGKLGQSVSSLIKALEDVSILMRLNDKVYVYANMSRDVNSSNSSLQELADRAEKTNVLVKEKVSWLSPELTQIPDNKMKEFLKARELAPYKSFIMDSLRTKRHTLSKDMEAMLAQSSALADSPENIQKMLAKDIKFPMIKDENGKDVQLTTANFISYMESKNQAVRKAAFQAYYQTLAKFQDSFGQTLAGEVKANNFYAKARKYTTAQQASLLPNNVPLEVYDQLIATVNKNLPLLHRYMELKKKMLGVKELHMYDLYVPIVEATQKYIPYEQAKQMVLDGLRPLGEDYIQLLEEAFRGGWIDVYSTDDKRSGAYQWGSYDTHPYVLLNYQGTHGDVSTIAHELGHAMQSYYTNKKQPYISSNYPIFTAEVASTMNETLMFKSMYAKAKTKQEKMFLLNQYLENFRTTLFRQTQFAEFEKAIHEMEQRGQSLNAETLKKLYFDINTKYYGKAVKADEEIAMEWARIPHFYYNFYVYQYATSFAASVALAKQVMDEGKPAVDRIRDKFLSAGSSDGPIEILKAAGVDMSTSKPIEQSLKVFEETLNELERLMNEK